LIGSVVGTAALSILGKVMMSGRLVGFGSPLVLGMVWAIIGRNKLITVKKCKRWGVE
jgi:hypothetical protein